MDRTAVVLTALLLSISVPRSAVALRSTPRPTSIQHQPPFPTDERPLFALNSDRMQREQTGATCGRYFHAWRNGFDGKDYISFTLAPKSGDSLGLERTIVIQQPKITIVPDDHAKVPSAKVILAPNGLRSVILRISRKELARCRCLELRRLPAEET